MSDNLTTNRSDTNAKRKFEEFLESKRFMIQKWNEKGDGKCPADIYAKYTVSGDYYFFEIKKTKTNEKKGYFGAATITEWKAAFDNPGRYFFVIAFEDNNNKDHFEFFIISPERFIRYSCVPPFKIDFNIPYKSTDNEIDFYRPGRKTDTVLWGKTEFKSLIKCWDKNKTYKRRKLNKESALDDFIKMDEFINHLE